MKKRSKSKDKKAKIKKQKKTPQKTVSKVKTTSKKVSKKIRKTSQTPKKTQPKTRSRTKAKTMEELVKSSAYQFKGLKKGAEVEGEITDISKKAVLIDIGAKTEGMVIDKEYELAVDFINQLKQGDKIKAAVVSPENDKGQILLSFRESALNHTWSFFEQALKSEETVEVRGLEVNKGGVIARLMGIRGFVPASQLGRLYLGKPHILQNKVFKTKIIEVDRLKNRLIFSEKQVSEAQALAEKKKALKKVKINDVYEGKVSGVMPFGIFVHVESKDLFLEGLVHISEVSWERVDDLGKMFKAGQKIKVKVLGVDEASGKLNLSLKQLSDDPWLKLVKKYKPEKRVKGEVTRLAAFGAFVQLESGIEGLIHISKIPADYEIKVGKKVDVYVESVDMEKRRMSLGLVLKEKPVGYK